MKGTSRFTNDCVYMHQKAKCKQKQGWSNGPCPRHRGTAPHDMEVVLCQTQSWKSSSLGTEGWRKETIKKIGNTRLPGGQTTSGPLEKTHTLCKDNQSALFREEHYTLYSI